MEIKLKQEKAKQIPKNLDKINDNKRKIQIDLKDQKQPQQKKTTQKDSLKKTPKRLLKKNSHSFSSDFSKTESFQKIKKQNNKSKQKKTTQKDLDRHHSLTRIKLRHQKQITIPGFDEYFLFQNKIIPIINSDQKRVVNNFVFTPNSTNQKWKCFDTATETYFSKKIQTTNCQIMTETPILLEQGLQVSAQLKSQSTITDLPLPIKNQQLKFDEFLMKLQFLYLPETRHFQELNQIQKEHYKELFQGIIKKLDKPQKNQSISEIKQDINDQSNQMFEEYQQNQKIAYIIQQRIAQQMNCIEVDIQKGIPTNLLSILSYLSNLFCFIEVQYKDLLLKGLNTPYGYTISHRLHEINQKYKYQPISNILPDQIYYEFQKQFFNDEGQDQLVMEAIHMHNKVIFDCLNEQLNVFRPYYGCNGEPYPWYTTGKITFFSIGENDIQLVFQKSKVKILEKASLLCGIICRENTKVYENIINMSPVLRDIRQERQKKQIYGQIKQIDESAGIQDERTLLMLQICDLLFQKLLKQESKQLFCLRQSSNNKIY